MKYKLLLWLLVPIFTACIETITIVTVPVDNILVVNALITPDSLFSCEVSKVYAVNDTTDHSVNIAEINIYNNANNELICPLVSKGNGSYESSREKPHEGIEYRIEVEAHDFPTVTGTTSIPSKPLASNVSIVPYAGYEALVNADYAEVKFTIDDHETNPNYYEAVFLEFFKTNGDWYIVGYKYDTEIEYEDSIYHILFYHRFSDYSIVDAVIKAEGTMEYNPSTLVFSDNLFNLKSHSFIARCFPETGHAYSFVCYGLHEDLYKLRMSLMQHLYEQGAKGVSRFDDLAGLDFSSNAIDVYSNLKGGYGIFAGYNTLVLYSGLDTKDYLPDGRQVIYLNQTENPYE